jgi:hypothetical protein
MQESIQLRDAMTPLRDAKAGTLPSAACTEYQAFFL